MKFDTQELRTVQFGKHQGKSYELMMKEHLNYCEWVINTYHLEPGAGDDLKHMAVYLLQQGHGGRSFTMGKEPETTKQTSTSSRSTKGDQ